MATPRRWFNQSLPQTLQIAMFLFYFNAVLGLLGVLSSGSNLRFAPALYKLLVAVSIGGAVGAANGIANEDKWGYKLGVVMSFLPFALRLFFLKNPFLADPITLLFEIALVALLLHPQSRDYQRIWFH